MCHTHLVLLFSVHLCYQLKCQWWACGSDVLICTADCDLSCHSIWHSCCFHSSTKLLKTRLRRAQLSVTAVLSSCSCRMSVLCLLSSCCFFVGFSADFIWYTLLAFTWLSVNSPGGLLNGFSVGCTIKCTDGTTCLVNFLKAISTNAFYHCIVITWQCVCSVLVITWSIHTLWR